MYLLFLHLMNSKILLLVINEQTVTFFFMPAKVRFKNHVVMAIHTFSLRFKISSPMTSSSIILSPPDTMSSSPSLASIPPRLPFPSFHFLFIFHYNTPLPVKNYQKVYYQLSSYALCSLPQVSIIIHE